MGVLVLTTVARVTVLNPGFDAGAVGRAGGYQRMYSEVLPSPPVQRAIRETLSGLPVDPTYVTANARLIVPPDVLESVVRTALSDYLRVVLGRVERVDLDRVVQPIIAHLVQLIHELDAGLVLQTRQVPVTSLKAFDRQVTQVIDRLATGHLHVQLPRIPIRAQDVPHVVDLLIGGLPPRVAQQTRRRLVPLLEAGDLSAAFALVLPRYLDQAATQRLGDRLARAADEALNAMADRPAVHGVHRELPLGLGWLTLIGLMLAACGLPVVLSARAGRARELALVLGAGAGFVLLLTVAGAQMWQHPLASLSRSVTSDPSLHRLATDIDSQVRHGVIQVLAAAVVLLALSATLAWLAPVLRRSPRRRWQPLVAAAATAALGVGALVAVVLPRTRAPAVCNGSPSLCQRRYDQVTFLTSHNAMASTDRGFLAADQDLDLVGQLDNGVRGLMLDLHYWTVPSSAGAYLADLDPGTRAAWAPLLRRFRPRPGVWLCHELCQIGADPAIPQLERLRDWLSRNPRDVVTLILQDDVSADDVVSTIDAAGLRPWLATPPPPGAPWPELGQLTAAHHTLFVFTQNATFSSGPIRNFYELAAETPYRAPSKADLSCQPGRGPGSASLFLINNWIGTGVPRRADALSVDRPSVLLRRISRCETLRHLRATFVAVDFSQVGHPLAAIDRLNGLR